MAADPGYVERVAKKISSELASRLGIPEPADAWRAFYAQVANETATGDASTRGVRNNNPLNLTDAGGAIQWGGQVGEDGPFAVFGSVDQGVDAAVQNLQAPEYERVRNSFRFGDPVALAHSIEASPWDAGHYSNNLASMIPEPGQTFIGGATDPHGDDGSCAPGWVKVLGVCVPISPAGVGAGAGVAAGGAIASGQDVGSAVRDQIQKTVTDPIGNAIGTATSNVMTGVRHFAVAAVVIAAIAALAVAGTRRTLD